MDTKENMLIARGKIITPDVVSCFFDETTNVYVIAFRSGKTYRYNADSLIWLKNPENPRPDDYRISHAGRELFGIEAVYIFKAPDKKYWHVCFENGTARDYEDSDLTVSTSCLHDATANNVFHYLKEAADLVSIEADDGTKLLSKQYEKLSFIDDTTALAPYLNPEIYRRQKHAPTTLIFPFGCNESQFRAVKAALENQISVIEGPPGTGKTQTILNIVANLLVAGKTIQIVSNNNSATANVLEKLSSPEIGLSFLAAPLGNTDNKKNFLAAQTGLYPDLSDWNVTIDDTLCEIEKCAQPVREIFKHKEILAQKQQELRELVTEQTHYRQLKSDVPEDIVRMRRPLEASVLMSLLHACQTSDRKNRLSLYFRIKARLLYGLSFRDIDTEHICTTLQSLYYKRKRAELERDITVLKAKLSDTNAETCLKEFSRLSMRYLKGTLYRRYGQQTTRVVFKAEDFFQQPKMFQQEYPIVLSTTHSSRSSLCTAAVYDYLIMDEASQVDIATGALALSSAANVVIVGDAKQLPNVVPRSVGIRADTIFAAHHVSPNYDFVRNSFLTSICKVFPGIPRTLLREHYRCHPKIIGFCNQKFYDGSLIVMSEDKGETDVLTVIKTVPGNHARGHMNRRQVESICLEIVPKIASLQESTGIITPYNDQVSALQAEINDPNIDIATVHKFQGREKDIIVLTTVDNEVTAFSDDPYLLNVAVSRAKKRLYLVVSGNSQPIDSNIADLISYIEYNNFTVTESKLYSVFDMLYAQYTESRFAYLRKHRKISVFDSENLMYALICDVLQECGLSSLGVICHLPLNMVIRDLSPFDEAEQQYIRNPATHLDFMIYNRISKKYVLAIEVDGYRFHRKGTRQSERDTRKDRILSACGLPCIRFTTNGSGEKEQLKAALKELFPLPAGRV